MMDVKEKIKKRLPNVDQRDIDRLSDEQADFIIHPLEESCFLSACPGGGKTQVVGIKTAYEIADWKDRFSGIAVLSFTKKAAKEIADRVAKYDGINATRHPHFIGTIDSWLHSYILHPFGHEVIGFKGREGNKSFFVVENKSDAEFLNNEKFNVLIRTPQGKGYTYNATSFTLAFNGDLETINSEDKIPENASPSSLKRIKDNLLKNGFCTYQDAEYLCYKVLKDNGNILVNLTKRFPVIMIDECQDLSQTQIRLFHLLIEKGVHAHFVGDINQAIYDFRKVYIDNFIAFLKHCNIKEKKLKDNYRSNQEIVDACGRIIEKTTNRISEIEGKEPLLHKESVILWEYTNIQDLPNVFFSLLNERGLDVAKAVILGRSHSLLSKIRPRGNSQYNKIELFASALNCWNASNRTGKDMQNALQQIGRSICYLAYKGNGNHQQQYCPESISSIEWRMFLHKLLSDASESLIHYFEEKTWSEWASSLKSFLKSYWENMPNGKSDWDSVKNKIKGSTNEKVIDKIRGSAIENSERIRLTTIHDVKGETFDSVLLVSAANKNSKGGHVEQWIGLQEEGKNEHIRFAYVASSRPKHLLVWAIPESTKSKKQIKTLLFGNQ